MSDRLRRARENAGYSTAASAIDRFKWPSSAYRSHENGQNSFSPTAAEEYAKAYGVPAAWLLLGEGIVEHSRSAKCVEHKHNCVEVIQATALLL